MINVTSYLVALVTFLAADMVWLGTMAPRLYRPTLGDIALPGVNLPAAIAFYAVYPVGLVIFVINPALKAESFSSAILYGALFGFFTYATYDLPNYATLRNWTMQLALVDAAWGTFLGAATSAVAFSLTSKLIGSA